MSFLAPVREFFRRMFYCDCPNENLRLDRTLVVYRRTDSLWAWKLLASNGNIVATDGGQGYVNKSTCISVSESITGLTAVLSQP